jgi:hypothetical protein
MDFQNEDTKVFNDTYITSTEICKFLKIPRATLVSGKRSGKLPDPIEVPHVALTIWNRDKVFPFIVRWKESLDQRRRID